MTDTSGLGRDASQLAREDYLDEVPDHIITAIDTIFDVVDEGGGEVELMDRLSRDAGEHEGFRLLAALEIRTRNIRRAHAAAAGYLQMLPEAEHRRCESCGEVCQNCLDEALGAVIDTHGDLDESHLEWPRYDV